MPPDATSARPHSGAPCATHLQYEMGCAEFDALQARAAGHCEACGVPAEMERRGLVIDHDHRYGLGAVRGLLCSRCNSHLGMLENPEVWPGFNRDERSRCLRKYLANAWFVQVAKSARANGLGLAAASSEQQALVAATLRNGVTSAVTRRTGTGPHVRLEVVALSGPATYQTTATYALRGDDLVLHFVSVGPRKVRYQHASTVRNHKPAKPIVRFFTDWAEALQAALT
jgi:hypothetical protein